MGGRPLAKRCRSNCRIVTVYLPQTELRILDRLCGADGVFPSRSEAVRQAVHLMVLSEQAHAVLLKQVGLDVPPPPEPEQFISVNNEIYQLVKN